MVAYWIALVEWQHASYRTHLRHNYVVNNAMTRNICKEIETHWRRQTKILISIILVRDS